MKSIFSIMLTGLLLASDTVNAALPQYTLMVPEPGTTTTAPNKASLVPALSSDGRYLMFASFATNLIAGFTDNNEASQAGGASDIFVRDMDTGTITLVTHASGSTTAGANDRFTGTPRASADGRFIIYASDATDLVPGKGGAQRPYFWDRTTGQNSFIADVQAQGVNISADGAWMGLFTSGTMPKNIYDSGQGNYSNPGSSTAGYLIDRVSGAVVLMTHQPADVNTAATTTLQSLVISENGNYAAFECSTQVAGWDPPSGGTYAGEAIYLYDRVADSMRLVTKRNDGIAASTSILNPTVQSISPDGRYLFFTHGDVNFGTASADSNGTVDLYRYDRDGGATRLSRYLFDDHAVSPNNFTSFFQMSPNGRYASFLSSATNLVAGDTNARNDVFRLDTTDSSVLRMNLNTDGSQWTDAVNGVQPASVKLFIVASPSVNNAGEVLFVSTAVGLGFTDSNVANDIFLVSHGSSASAPTVTTPTKASITHNSATLGGNVTADGGAALTERGVVHAMTSVNSNPEIGGVGVTKVVAGGTTTGVFTAAASGLVFSTGYTYKAYATNSSGTSYSSADSFTTAPAPVAVVNLERANATPSKAATVNWTLTLASVVTGLTAANFELTGVAATGASVGTPSTGNGGLSWTVPVTTGGTDGELTLRLANATGLSAALTGLPYTGQSYTMDKTAPQVQSVVRQVPTGQTTSATSLTFRVTYTEAVTGVGTGRFALQAVNGSTVTGTVTGVTPVSASVYDVAVSVTGGDGEFRLRVLD